ncbi:MAG: helicase-exonuclease AddAB subunit AddA [Butyrivibrio sp.]|nr:helicase-exonuclease AddAB subunit AddA [Acetatifactor muris]MCM1559008.1 helicase-exonuclease AddAB subunit AddA [Butyrivibrio sp.]
MAVAFTPEQQNVIDLRDRNILVSAAAGSGKTAVLVERIVKMVCDEEKPVDIDRLLVVTFTNAAASEMRERIAAGIAAMLAQHPDSDHIQRQAALLHNAQITTIDSFCLFLLRNHFNEIGLDPAFRIGDEGEIRLMQQEVLQELMEESYASESEAFRYCVEFFCPGGKESTLEQHILNLSHYASGFPWPEEWLEERREDYSAGDAAALCESSCGRYLTGHLAAMAEGWIHKLERVQALCLEPDGPYMYGEMVEKELEQLERLGQCTNLAEYEAWLPAVQFGRLSSKKDESVNGEKRELAAGLRAEVKESVRGTAERFFVTPLELAAAQAADCREPVCTLIDLALDFRRRLAEKKQEKKVVDFTDMEHFALNILLEKENGVTRPSRVALEYRQHFAEILIDEYQDSNLVQEILLGAVSGEEDGHFNRFMVGDVKQSIYKFRLARPELFLEKYHTYAPMPAPAGEGSEPGQGALNSNPQPEYTERQRIDLTKNFRSRVQVVQAVNDVFSRLMNRQTGGLAYDDRAALYPGAVYPENTGNESELLLVEKPRADAESDARQAEARAIAAKIKELRTGFTVTDRTSGELRPAEYSDMVILLRAASGWDEEFRAVLEEEGIPVYITSRTGYFGATEVQELLQLLRVLDNPRQDIPLFGVMKSVFGGFTEEEIALLRSGGRKGSLYQAVEYFAAGETAEYRKDGGLRDKAAAFLRRIGDYRRCTVYMPVRELLTRLITDFDYLNYVTALPAGGKRRANVEMLLTRASDFEKTSYFGLFHFIRYMEQLEKYDVDYGEAELLDENANVVRIMSIHKSKGLEFPITFVSGLGKRFNMQDANRSLILDMDLGLATDYVNPGRRIKNKTLRRNVLARKAREESLAEELRVLYVAMTRAREKLILTASMENAAEKWERLRKGGDESLLYPDFIESGSYLDFLMPIVSGTCIGVTVLGEEELAAGNLKEQLEMGDRAARLERAADFADEAALERLRKRLEVRYPFENLAGLYTKTTVSELKIAAMADRDEAAYHTFEEKEVQPYIPTFRRQEEKVSGTVRGNAYHRVMELLDFGRIMSMKAPESGENTDIFETYGAYRSRLNPVYMKEQLRKFLKAEVESGRLKEEYARAVNVKKVLCFLESELAWRMWRAERSGRLCREQPFVMGVSASKLGQEFPDSERVLIQGIIDVFFEEEDGIVLLDYKTDAVSSLRELWNRYETQMDYYSQALLKLTGKPVKERILYSFHLNQYQ